MQQHKNSAGLGKDRLWNCLGSYYQYILDKGGYEDEWLCVFKGYYMNYRELNMDLIYKKYKKNPWGYQPIKLMGVQEFDFQRNIKNYFAQRNIQLSEIKSDSLNSIKEYICCSEGSYIIINVDEFYLKYLPTYYQKVHNKHFVLVDEVKDSYITVLDTEVDIVPQISFDELERAALSENYRNMRIYRVILPSQKEKNDIIYDPYCELLKVVKYNSWYDDFLNDIKERFNDENRIYYLQGLNFAIIYKLIPYLKWICYLENIENDNSNSIFYPILNNLRKLSFLLMKDLIRPNGRNEVAVEELCNKIAIYAKETVLNKIKI